MIACPLGNFIKTSSHMLTVYCLNEKLENGRQDEFLRLIRSALRASELPE